MSKLSLVLGCVVLMGSPAFAAERERIKLPAAPSAKGAKAGTQAEATKKKRKGPRFQLKRNREVRGLIFRDWDSGLQFAVKRGKLRKLKAPKKPEGVVWETQVSVGTIAIRTRADTIEPGTFRSGPELKDYLEGLSMAYRDEENVRDVVVLESDMLDSMGLVEAGATLDVVLPKGRHCCEQLWVLVRGSTRVTMSIRCTNSDYRRRWGAFQDKFLEALKLTNTDNWK